MANMSNIQCLLLDIEGTTTSISFVKDVLFPYVRENLESFLELNWEDPLTKEDVQDLRKQATKDLEDGLKVPPIMSPDNDKTNIIKSVIANVHWQMDRDRKVTALKQLQGHMWKEAYEQGLIRGQYANLFVGPIHHMKYKTLFNHSVYDDVPEALEKWTSAGKKVYIYSSGSVGAQKLLFGHSLHGDLLQYLSGHFDTTVGLKNQPASYISIVSTLGVPAENILFLTDIPAEAEAAAKAGMQARLMIRPGNGALNEDQIEKFSPFESFKGVSQLLSL